MSVRLFVVTVALAIVPAVSHAQQGGAPTGPVHRLDVRTNTSDDAYNDPAGLVRSCLAECFTSDPSLQAGVCGGEVRPGELSHRCFGSGTPACDRAARAIATGANLLAVVSRRCQEPPAPAAAARPAVAEVDRDAIRRRREQRADAQCGSAGALRAMCRRCATSGDRTVWLSGNFSPAVIRMMAGRTDLAPPSDAEEYRFRCQGSDTAPIAGALGSLGREVESANARVRGVESDVRSITLTGAPASPETVEGMRVLFLAFQRAMVLAEIRQAANDVRLCAMEGVRLEGDRCGGVREALARVEDLYAPLLARTQGLDHVGVVPFMDRLARVRDLCRDVTADRATACMRARDELTEALTQVMNRSTSRPPPRALARDTHVPQTGAHDVPVVPPAPAAPVPVPVAAPAPAPTPAAPSPTGGGTVVYPEFE